MKKTHHCHHATRWSSNGEDLKPTETRCNAPKTTRSRSSTYSDQFTRSFSSHQNLHNLKRKQHDIFWYLEAPCSYASNKSRIKSIGGSYKRGLNPRKEAAAHGENKIVEMRTTTTKRSLGNASIGPREMKFKSLEQNKDSKSIGKRRHKLATSDARRC
jgi:hypothetical protein